LRGRLRLRLHRWRRCDGDGRLSWRGLNCLRRLCAGACDRDASSSHDADDDGAGSCTDQKIASSRERTDMLAAARLGLGRLRVRRTNLFGHNDLPYCEVLRIARGRSTVWPRLTAIKLPISKCVRHAASDTPYPPFLGGGSIAVKEAAVQD
jgi:hypothetical protein